MQNKNIPNDVIIVRSKGAKFGKLLTVALEPHAKTAEADKPTNKPIPKLNSFGETPVAINPPVITSSTDKRNRLVTDLWSNITSNRTAKIGMHAAANAAVTAFEIDWANKSIIEPVPKPTPPISAPLNHGKLSIFLGPIKRDVSKIKNPKPTTFLKSIKENTSQLCNNPSAAGKPTANRKIAITQVKLPRRYRWRYCKGVCSAISSNMSV